MRHGKLMLLVLGLVLGLATPASGAGSDNRDSDRRGTIVRWDLVEFVENVVLAGGTDVSAADGERIALTGSGHAEPWREKAYGGGTFVHRRGGAVVGRGAYYVTAFRSWERLLGGSLAGTGLTDGIGAPGTESSGILKLRVHFVAESGTEFNGVLTIYCHLPGTIRDVPEGFTLTLPRFELNFDRQVSGVTLFHIVRPRHLGER